MWWLLACSPPPAPVSTAPAPVPVPAPAVDSDPEPAFEASTRALTDDERQAMIGVSWREGCPVALEALARISASHWGFDGVPRTGHLVVRADVAPVFIDALRAAWDAGFPIERMEPIEVFGGDDDASMAANNTSAFNCRPVTGGTGFSQHSFGHAIDVNPVQNPYVTRSGTVLPPSGEPYLVRDPAVPGLLVEPGAVVDAFRAHGWGWGGTWTTTKDYQHFSETNR
jgi:hypothetical protein